MRVNRIYLDFLDAIRPKKPLCQVCEREGGHSFAAIKGMCNRHYQRLLRYGDPNRKPDSRSAYM